MAPYRSLPTDRRSFLAGSAAVLATPAWPALGSEEPISIALPDNGLITELRIPSFTIANWSGNKIEVGDLVLKAGERVTLNTETGVWAKDRAES